MTFLTILLWQFDPKDKFSYFTEAVDFFVQYVVEGEKKYPAS